MCTLKLEARRILFNGSVKKPRRMTGPALVPHFRPVLHCFQNVIFSNLFGSFQVRDSAGYFYYAMICARRQVKLFCGLHEYCVYWWRELAKCFDIARAHFTVCGDARFFKAFGLPGPRFCNALLNDSRRFSCGRVCGEFFVFYRIHINPQVNAISYGS